MENKQFILNIQDKLISSIKSVEQEGNDSNFNQKEELVNKKFKDAFNDIVSLIEDMSRGKVAPSHIDRILNQIQEEFGYTKNAIGRSLQREIENKDGRLDLDSLLSHLVSHFGVELEEISNLDEEVDISDTGISQSLSRVRGTIDDEREESYKSARIKFEYEVNDTIMTDLKYKINNILNRSGINMSIDMDELQYYVNRTLSAKLLEPILNDSQEIDNITLKKAGIDEETILSELYKEISNRDRQEKEVEDPSDEFQKELMDDVKTNTEMFDEGSVVEENSQIEKETTRESLEALFK